MKYFLDFEFIEGFKKPLFGKRRHFIDMISVGIVAEDGREYYAISNEFKWDDANEWVKENVLSKLEGRHCTPSGWFNDSRLWKSNKQIAKEIFEFVNPDLGFHISGYSNSELREGFKLNAHFKKHNVTSTNDNEYYVAQPEFYGYYADYDWVLFCSLFGTMMQLPKGFPMYCIDLKQTLDEKAESLSSFQLSKLAHTDIVTHNVYSTYDTGVLKCSKTDLLKNALNYPKQSNEHNALDDAKWNKSLYEFLIQP